LIWDTSEASSPSVVTSFWWILFFPNLSSRNI
jgi:hypothetical protein